ncbi:hypothetical protein VTJ83DRAFT_815 [Remersonia thermophila]|uniref:RRM domain-containing protein n=1 Tax=Remersonia thermophila TaxID=72144 RepID=A0ABR4DMW9_9PEZI
MYRRESHAKTLQAFTVKPGPETGLYYILVANLAHKTTWKDLKAFASQACEVDHAEVYPPTSGFVRVRGRTNFEKAFKFLDGNTLEYRALQADARNLTQPTVVKLQPTDYHAVSILRGEEGRLVPEDDDFAIEAAGGGGHPFAFAQGASPAFNALSQMDPWGYATPRCFLPDGCQALAVATSSPRAYAVTTASQDWMLTTAAGAPQPVMYSSLAGPVASLAPSSPSVAFQLDPPSACYATESAYDAGHGPYAVFAQQPPLASETTAYGADVGYFSARFSALSLGADAYHPAKPEQPQERPQGRELLLLHLPRDRRSEPAVLSLLARHAAAAADAVDKVRLPTNNSGRSRGAAYVTFASAEMARAAAKALDGREVGSGAVALRAKVLGAEEGGDRGGGGSRSRQQQRPGSGGAGGASRKKAAKVASSPMGGSGASGGRVAGPESGGGEKRKKAREEPPVIVDGSGGRRQREAAPVVVDGSARNKGSGGDGHRSGRR